MKSHVKRYWWWYLLRGALALLFGTSVIVTAVLFPETTILSLVMALGAYLVLTGAVSVASAVVHRPRSYALLVNGLLHIALGVLAFVWTDATAVAMLFVFALSMVAIGLMDLVSAIRLRHVLKRQWTIALSGLLSIVSGGLIMLFPAIGAFGVLWIVGASAALFGVFSISCGWRMQRHHPPTASPEEAHPQAQSAPA